MSMNEIGYKMVYTKWAVLLVLFYSSVSFGDVSDIVNPSKQQHERHIRSDDVSLASLVVTSERQAAMMTSLQAELNTQRAQTEALKADLDSIKTKVTSLSHSVAFTVRFQADDGTNGLPVGNNAPLRFDSVAINLGSGYDPQTGIFTAPVAGTYCFFVVLMGAGSHGYVDLWLMKSGNVVLDIIYAQDNNGQGSGLVTSHLGQGDRVWVQHAVGEAVRGSWYTYFTGFLITAE